MNFKLTSSPIEREQLEHDAAGGFVTFEGKVRNHASGRQVVGLEYEAHEEMALVQGEELLKEAQERFDLLDASVTHRIGKLRVGQTAVLVQVASAHRRDSFMACEWIMDQLKWRVPIWKRETYSDGVSEWVMAEAPSSSPSSMAMFERQMRLPQVGAKGQSALLRTSVLLVGAGGLASGSLPPLVGAGIGTIGIIDHDTVDETNLHRQTLFAATDVGRLKVERAAHFAKRLRKNIKLIPIPEKLSETNVEHVVRDFDWIVDGTDSLETKFLLNRTCRKMGKPLVTASVHQFEGHIMTVLPGGPCLECLFPQQPPDHCVGTCAQSGVLGVVPTIMGSLQANEVIKGVLGMELLADRLALLDLRTLELTLIAREKHKDCSRIDRAFELDSEPWDLPSLPDGKASFLIVDVRDLDESPALSVPHVRVPMAECYSRSWTAPTVFVCAAGQRSYRLAADLRARGISMVFSLQGGIYNPSLIDG